MPFRIPEISITVTGFAKKNPTHIRKALRGGRICCSGLLLIKDSFCNSFQHASPVSVPNRPLFSAAFDRPVTLHYRKRGKRAEKKGIKPPA